MAKQSASSVPTPTTNTAPANQEVFWNLPPEEVKAEGPEVYEEPCGWMESPARWRGLAKASADLVEVATRRQTPMIEVPKVRVCVPKGEKAAYVVPTSAKDPLGIKVTTRSNNTYMNLASALLPVGIRVPKGYKDRYKTSIVGPEDGSPCGWALKIDLSKYEDRKESGRKGKKAGPAAPGEPK